MKHHPQSVGSWPGLLGAAAAAVLCLASLWASAVEADDSLLQQARAADDQGHHKKAADPKTAHLSNWAPFILVGAG